MESELKGPISYTRREVLGSRQVAEVATLYFRAYLVTVRPFFCDDVQIGQAISEAWASGCRDLPDLYLPPGLKPTQEALGLVHTLVSVSFFFFFFFGVLLMFCNLTVPRNPL